MNGDRRILSADDRRGADQLGCFWDEYVASAGYAPEIAPELADLAEMVRRLHATRRTAAPAAVHAAVCDAIAAHPAWVIRATAPVTVRRAHAAPNGHAPRGATGSLAPAPLPRPGPIRRIWPAVELVGFVALVLALLYLAVARGHHATVVTPTPAPTPVATAAPTPRPGAVGDWPMLGGGPSRAAGTDRSIPATLPVARWQTKLAPGVRGIVAAGDQVYATDGGTLTALDIATGAVRWHANLGVTPSVAGASAPAVVAGTVYVAAHDGTVYAFDAATGQERWRRAAGGPVTTAVAVASGVVYAGTTSGEIVALDAATGKPRWRYPTGPVSSSSPVVSVGVVYVGGGTSTVFALDAATGSVRWRRDVSAGMKSVAIGDGIALAGSRNAGNFSSLVALDTATGAQRWSAALNTDLPPAIVGGNVYIIDGDNTVLRYDSQTGGQSWQTSVPLQVVAMVNAGDALALCEMDGTVTDLDAASGHERWQIATGAGATGIAIGAGTVYVAHKDGTVGAYG